MTKRVFFFGGGDAEGSAAEAALLGGKGANLAEMCRLGLPVPPGFTLTTEVGAEYRALGGDYPQCLTTEGAVHLSRVEGLTGLKFGDPEKPLLLSVRSGAQVSMPGMMDTVLNLGLNDETVEGLARFSGDARFAWDSYRRFIQMYADIVLGVDHHHFEDILLGVREAGGNGHLTAQDCRRLVADYLATVKEETGKPFPQDPKDQLWGAIGAVFASWDNARAVTYRRLNGISDSLGTAVTVQAMVFGNRGETSATGVAFTRNPSTGERQVFGEYLPNAQGEEVVAGLRTPNFLTKAGREAAMSDAPSMEEAMPGPFAELMEALLRLESHYRDMQDVEFTVQQGRLWILQTRTAKRSTNAALKIAVAMANEGTLSREEAILRVDPMGLDQLLHDYLDPAAPRDVITRGLPASPGAASGRIVFSSDEAEQRAAQGQNVILVRVETSPEDVHGMHAARGILTSRGGMTSHAAVVARGMGRACVCGAAGLRVDYEARTLTCLDRVFREGETLTIDGSTGEVMAGFVPALAPELTGDFATLMSWADAKRRMAVRANAETPEDVETALRFGAEGIGLCRTEHMFFDPERIIAVREMILAETPEGRRAALAKIAPMQKGDFVRIFEIMKGRPVTIRLLDPPLHEFLPDNQQDLEDLARDLGVDPKQMLRRARELKETNPMLGHRGCRLGISYPEIYEMQARAIFEATIQVKEDTGETVVPEIMVPLVSSRSELDVLKARIDAVAAEIGLGQGHDLAYLVGTMIELPRAAITAASIAEVAEFFSFGTNDLTQSTYGISRDDSAGFMADYLRQGVYRRDPFMSLDQEGVGALVKMGADGGRAVRPGIKLGISGEHGGDPASIRFCEALKLDYVSCSPYRVPIARLAAAQAALGG